MKTPATTEQSLERCVRQLLLLQETAKEVNSILDLEQLLDQIVGGVADEFGCNRTAVLLKDETTTSWRWLLGAGSPTSRSSKVTDSGLGALQTFDGKRSRLATGNRSTNGSEKQSLVIASYFGIQSPSDFYLATYSVTSPMLLEAALAAQSDYFKVPTLAVLAVVAGVLGFRLQHRWRNRRANPPRTHLVPVL